MAVEKETGARTTVRQKSLLVGGAAGTAPIDGSYRFEVGMNLPAGSYRIAVSVRDETTGPARSAEDDSTRLTPP